MPNDYFRPHLDISSRQESSAYKSPSRNMGESGAPRLRAKHGARVQAEFRAALAIMDSVAPSAESGNLKSLPGRYVEVELLRGRKAEDVERKSDGIRPAASQHQQNDALTLALFIPNDARQVFEEIIEDYTSGPLTPKGKPKRQQFVESIESIRQARLETFWTDTPDTLPSNPEDSIWWEVWCYTDRVDDFMDSAQSLNCQLAPEQYWMHYPEVIVIPMFTRRVEIELMLFANVGMSELRRASVTPTFFTELGSEEQHEWAADLATRITWPSSDAPAVCLLDTGVNRAHPLIEPALSPDNLDAVNAAWGVDDHQGHGTAMAGLALYGDLTAQLTDYSEMALSHRLESVKLLPPAAFPVNEPKSYGAITQAAISLGELLNTERNRAFCMAITNNEVSGQRASNWSSAIDQAAAGAMLGDEEEAPKRLIFVSGGNIPEDAATDSASLKASMNRPIEDPAQAWNAITVGGYTDKTLITEPDLSDWQPVSEIGGMSPHSRTSVEWHAGRMPYKPEIVMEAGNRAINADESEVLTPDSLSLLSTCANVDRRPLRDFCATSAATAQAARLAAQIAAAHSEYWPETIRGLIVHSAQWTPLMQNSISENTVKKDRANLLKRFGYGVPSLERALASASNDLALIAQSGIQPYRVEGSRKFNECHYYDLPWPRHFLENLDSTTVKLRIVLSYFVEPSPGFSASIDPQRYQSFGLRFDLKRRLEHESKFRNRVNASEPKESGDSESDEGWLFGTNSIHSGSLHCDEWTGPAIHLASRNTLCVKPVAGWWRSRASAKVCNSKARYSLIMTLSSEDNSVDLYTPIKQMIGTQVDVEIDV